IIRDENNNNKKYYSMTQQGNHLLQKIKNGLS
ncbi:TPA: DUF3116 family protein, partial [Listeria innocua]|nr:DUF3116 family protein [Listeria innocua]